MLVLSLVCDVCEVASEPEVVRDREYSEAARILADESRARGWVRRCGEILCPACVRIERAKSLVVSAGEV